MTGGAHDTLRDQLVLDMARQLCKAAKPTPTGPVPCLDHMGEARSLFLIARRFADAQVAAEREAWWRNLIGVRVNRGTVTDPDWYMHHPSDVELVYPTDEQP